MIINLAGLLSALLIFTMSVEAATSHGIAPTRNLYAQDLIRVRASTDERQSTVVEWQGQVL